MSADRDAGGSLPYRASLNHSPVLDANYLIQGGWLEAGRRYVWGWDAPCWASLYLVVGEHCLTLSFLPLEAGSASAIESQCIPLEWTPCHFGGVRPMLVCPHCDHAHYRLYYRSGSFACQHCQNLKHRYDRRETAEEREARRARLLGGPRAEVPAEPPADAAFWAALPQTAGDGAVSCSDVSPRVRPARPRTTAAAAVNPAKLGLAGRKRMDLYAVPCTCGRGDGLEGHRTTCRRGRIVYMRKRRGIPLE